MFDPYLIKTFLLVCILETILFFIIKKIGVYDQPSERKMHENPKLTMGGLLFIVPFILIGGKEEVFRNVYTAIAFFLVIAVGIFDDLKGATAKMKLGTQLIAGALLFFGGSGFTSFLGIENTVVLFLLTIFYYASFINIINLVDGADGLAVLLSTVIFSGLYSVSFLTPSGVMMFNIVICLLVFLIFNIKNSIIFMGDTGSNFLGFLMGMLFLNAGFSDFTTNRFLPFILLIALPFFDTLFAIIRRIKNKKSILDADKKHIHHILIKKYNLNRALIIIVLLQVIFSFLGIRLYGVML